MQQYKGSVALLEHSDLTFVQTTQWTAEETNSSFCKEEADWSDVMNVYDQNNIQTVATVVQYTELLLV